MYITCKLHAQVVVVLTGDVYLPLLSVQCYAWTEYKFTCVCVTHRGNKKCVTVTLSVNSPTGQSK